MKSTNNYMTQNFEYEAEVEATNLTDEQLSAFYTELEKIPSHRSPISGDTAVLCFQFMEDTGCRVNETIHVKKKDINFQTRVIIVTQPKSEVKCKCSKWKNKNEYSTVKVLAYADKNCQKCYGKGKYKKPQKTTFTPRLYERLKEYCDTLNDDDYLFPISRQSLWKWGKKAGSVAGINIFQEKDVKKIEGIFLHLFRALCSLRMTRDAKDDPYQQQLVSCKLRHSIQYVTDRYTKQGINYLINWEKKTYGLFSMIPDKSGIYYLYEKGKLLYIGKAKTLKFRIQEHKTANKSVLSYIDFIRNNTIDDILRSQNMLTMTIYALSETQRIDLIFNRVTDIKFDVLDYDMIDEVEKNLIHEYKPPFNHETKQFDDIDLVLEKLDKIRSIQLKETL